MEGWNYTARLYRLSKEILDGSWKFLKLSRLPSEARRHGGLQL